ncbi:SAGA-associated factor 29 [Exophiala viscosa]|uniref:SAGA-associated factor 29 n=1 Tax=Exophiala viscosa TaxID=2486360 RepID=UPI00219FA94E|nr:SAGA-associated factor 29 [Exophiala viscosa]
MSGRPRGGRGLSGREGKETDLENDLLSRAVESLRKAQSYNDQSKRIGQDIIALEEEIKANGHSTPDNHRRLDALYRENLKCAENEKKVHDDEDIINNLAILATMKSNDDLAPRNGQPKSRKHQRPTIESDVVVESPGPSPGDGRLEMMKRVKGAAPRSSSTASQNRAATVPKDDGIEPHKGVQAEKAGQLISGIEVFYKYPKDQQENEEGVGIHGIIKKVWQEKRPIQYDVRDPEDDASGKQTVRKATARDLVPIPQTNVATAQFPIGATVYAKYPDTDTFYRARVKSFQKTIYSLKFDEDDKEMLVDVRFVLDPRMR